MHIFINDVFVHLAKPGDALEEDRFNFIVNASEQRLTRANLIHHVWVKGVKASDIEGILKILDTPLIARNLFSLTLSCDDYDKMKNEFKSHFKIIRAAGGVVRKEGKTLMILRLGKWDLPKGKIDKGEDTEEAALREVFEECGVKATTKSKICNTWHTYTMKRSRILKKTTWYSMNLVDDSKMQPQTEEEIAELRWMTPKEVYHALENSYKSIEYVMDMYFKKKNSKSDRIG